MKHNDITVTFTESEHDLLLEVLTFAQDAFNLACPSKYDMTDDQLDRYNNLVRTKSKLTELWLDRYNKS